MTGSGLFYCPRCGKQSAVWQNDFDVADLGYDGEGIVTYYTCSECGSEIEVITRENNDGEE